MAGSDGRCMFILKLLHCLLFLFAPLFSKVVQLLAVTFSISASSVSSSCSTPLQTLDKISLLNSNHSNRCAVISCWGFHSYFPNDFWFWASFHMHICHSHIPFSVKYLLKIFCFLKIWLSYYYEFFTYSRYKFFVVYVLQIVFPNLWLHFHCLVFSTEG